MKKSTFLFLILLATVSAIAQNPVRIKKLSNEGNPIIFLPHIGCSSEMWEKITPHFLKTHSVYLANFAGFNGEKPIKSNFTQNYVTSIQEFIKKNGLKKVVLVGQNYGAFIAINIAQDKELEIKAIVASDFYPKLSMVLIPDITTEQLEQMTGSIRKGILEINDEAFTAAQKQTAEMMNFSNPEDVAKFVTWQCNSDRNTLAETLCEQFSADLLPMLENNNIPILAFTTWYFAKQHKNAPISEADNKLKEMFGNTPLIKHAITEEAKDFIACDQPQWFINEMDNFLNSTVGK